MTEQTTPDDTTADELPDAEAPAVDPADVDDNVTRGDDGPAPVDPPAGTPPEDQ